MRICRRCGVYAPLGSAVCESCNAEVREFAAEVAADRYRYALVLVERRCPRCERFTPVDGLRADGIVRCARCKAEHPLPDDTWRQLLHGAHAVADLFGEHPEGFEVSSFAIDQVNPFAQRARQSAGVWFAHEQADAMEGWLPADYRAFTAPGRPIAGDTIEPVEVDREGPGMLRTRSRHGVVLRYAVDPRFIALHGELVGVIAHEHRIDRIEPDVVLDGKRWTCPGCGEGLKRVDGSPFLVRCAACGLVANIPSQLRRSSQSDPRPDPVWLVFDGPSAYRRLLERHPSAGRDAPGADLPLERMALVGATPNGRLVRWLYVAVVPALFFAFAGLVSRWETVWGWVAP